MKKTLALILLFCYNSPVAFANNEQELNKINAEITDDFLIVSHLDSLIRELKTERKEKLQNIVKLYKKKEDLKV